MKTISHDELVNDLHAYFEESKSITDIVNEKGDYGDIYQLLSCLKQYGCEGVLDVVVDEDIINDLLCAYVIFDSFSMIRGLEYKGLDYYTECLEAFFARAKLDVYGEGNYEVPYFIEITTSIIDDFCGKTELTKLKADYLSVRELSFLWNMTPEAIRNEVLSKPEIKKHIQKFGNLLGVPAKLAYQLSRERLGFRMSQYALVEKPNMRLVPVTSKGEKFDENCRNANGTFRIGPKGKEFPESNFNEALKILRQMKPKPYWRRKNKSGNWGLVAGVTWEYEPIK